MRPGGVLNTVFAAFAVFICLLGIAVATWDYVRWEKHEKTISDYFRALWTLEANRPVFWASFGAVVAGAVMLVVGVILGHLTWPNQP